MTADEQQSIAYVWLNFSLQSLGCAAGVVVSCKIPILATRVRFPGGAGSFLANSTLKTSMEHDIEGLEHNQKN